MKAKNVFKEINKITRELIQCGLADEYKQPTCEGGEVSWVGCSDLSNSMKNLPYKDIYDHINKNRNFNFKLVDGGIFQLLYYFDNQGLLKHRLAYFPSPSFEELQNNPEIYSNDTLYGDVVNRQVMPVIIRVDYNRESVDSEIHHPYSHLTLGQYKNCRIPIQGPLSPNKFISFIMEHFYYVPSQIFFDYSFVDVVEDYYSHLSEIDMNKIYLKIIE